MWQRGDVKGSTGMGFSCMQFRNMTDQPYGFSYSQTCQIERYCRKYKKKHYEFWFTDRMINCMEFIYSSL